MLINFDLLVVFAFPLKSKELRQRNKLFWYLNIQPSLMYATAVFVELSPSCCNFWRYAVICGLWGLTGLSCCWKAQGKKKI